MSTDRHNFKIEERRRQVASLVARGDLTQQEMGRLLGVNQSVISDDIRAIKELAQQFVYDLAKSDLAFYYKQCIDEIQEAKAQAWKIYLNDDTSTKERLLALRLIVDSAQAKHKLFSEGPSVLNTKILEQRISRIENEQQQRQIAR